MIFSKRMFLQALALLGLGAGAARFAPAAAAPDAQSKAALGVVDAWYLPKTEAVVAAFDAQQKAWETGCRDGKADLAALQAAFQAASDAWMQIAYASFGPLGVHQRADRVSFFPDRRNVIQRQVNELLSRAQKGVLNPDELANASVAGQGLPALERLLYDPAMQKSVDADPARAQARCVAGLVVAQNLANIAHAVKAEWLAPDGPRARLAAGEGSPPAFADGRQALASEVTDLATGLQTVIDLKILRFIGTSLDTVNPQLAEGARSGRVKRNLVMAAQGIADEAKALAATTPDTVRQRVDQAADALVRRFSAMPDDVNQLAADPARRDEASGLIAPLRALQTLMSEVLAPALGVQLGFNALDGD